MNPPVLIPSAFLSTAATSLAFIACFDARGKLLYVGKASTWKKTPCQLLPKTGLSPKTARPVCANFSR